MDRHYLCSLGGVQTNSKQPMCKSLYRKYDLLGKLKRESRRESSKVHLYIEIEIRNGSIAYTLWENSDLVFFTYLGDQVAPKKRWIDHTLCSSIPMKMFKTRPKCLKIMHLYVVNTYYYYCYGPETELIHIFRIFAFQIQSVLIWWARAHFWCVAFMCVVRLEQLTARFFLAHMLRLIGVERSHCVATS